jgi:resuscitation-promoting factor RpfB
MAERVDGKALAAVAAGGVFVWAGIRGFSIPQAVQNIVTGKTPGAGQTEATLTAAASSAPAGGAPSGSIAPGAASAQAWAKAHLADYGWGPDQFAPLLSLWNQESGWRWNATNPTSGAYGIPQSLPASKMAADGSDWKTNPVTQMRWGLGYIKGTYGSPAKAWEHEQSNNWY